jgi:hypothetical protein
MKNQNRFIPLALLLLAVFYNGTAYALLIAPGDSAFISGSSLADQPILDGNTLYQNSLSYDLLATPWIFAGHADVVNSVIHSTLSDSLVFSLQLLDGQNPSEDDIWIDSITMNGYAGWDTDVFYRTDTVGDRGPTFASRSADGDMLRFDFSFPLTLNNLVGGVQEQSYPLEILTDASSFATTGRAWITAHTTETSLAVSFAGLAVPTVSVPLPATSSLLLPGLLLLVGFRHKPSNHH